MTLNLLHSLLQIYRDSGIYDLPKQYNYLMCVCLCMLYLLDPFHDQVLSLHESKGLMTSQKSRLCGTMALPCPWPYYPSPRICIPFFAIGRSASMALL
ncbi:hypothetical protein C4D60_Mb08t19360 [Musa balbisiana]|uniref:Uncharacterized protein n=1 Tax=Musa balbisiana TaxID=52838 RepID=A0A4S8K4X7_MUSBA|nr:hypothetical protein C4D60_Mb08t19360 [Musa balbisiana]